MNKGLCNYVSLREACTLWDLNQRLRIEFRGKVSTQHVQGSEFISNTTTAIITTKTEAGAGDSHDEEDCWLNKNDALSLNP